MIEIEKAIILAAGLGTRLRPITLTTPKPLVRVGNKCLLDWGLDQLAHEGIEDVVVNTSYLYEQVEEHVSQRAGLPRITISREVPTPLETGGGIAKALPLLGQKPFAVLNSDTICIDIDEPTALTRMRHAWSDFEDIDFLLLLQPIERSVGFYANGDFICDAAGRIRRPYEGERSPYVFTGIEIIHPRAFEACPQGAFSLNRLWSREMTADGWFSRVAAIIHSGDWLHIGDPQGLADVERYFASHSSG